MTWLFYAFVSAAASALTAILAKLGVEGEPIGWRVAAGVALMTVGALLTLG